VNTKLGNKIESVYALSKRGTAEREGWRRKRERRRTRPTEAGEEDRPRGAGGKILISNEENLIKRKV